MVGLNLNITPEPNDPRDIKIKWSQPGEGGKAAEGKFTVEVGNTKKTYKINVRLRDGENWDDATDRIMNSDVMRAQVMNTVGELLRQAAKESEEQPDKREFFNNLNGARIRTGGIYAKSTTPAAAPVIDPEHGTEALKGRFKDFADLPDKLKELATTAGDAARPAIAAAAAAAARATPPETATPTAAGAPPDAAADGDPAATGGRRATTGPATTAPPPTLNNRVTAGAPDGPPAVTTAATTVLAAMPTTIALQPEPATETADARTTTPAPAGAEAEATATRVATVGNTVITPAAEDEGIHHAEMTPPPTVAHANPHTATLVTTESARRASTILPSRDTDGASALEHLEALDSIIAAAQQHLPRDHEHQADLVALSAKIGLAAEHARDPGKVVRDQNVEGAFKGVEAAVSQLVETALAQQVELVLDPRDDLGGLARALEAATGSDPHNPSRALSHAREQLDQLEGAIAILTASMASTADALPYTESTGFDPAVSKLKGALTLAERRLEEHASPLAPDTLQEELGELLAKITLTPSSPDEFLATLSTAVDEAGATGDTAAAAAAELSLILEADDMAPPPLPTAPRPLLPYTTPPSLTELKEAQKQELGRQKEHIAHAIRQVTSDPDAVSDLTILDKHADEAIEFLNARDAHLEANLQPILKGLRGAVHTAVSAATELARTTDPSFDLELIGRLQSASGELARAYSGLTTEPVPHPEAALAQVVGAAMHIADLASEIASLDPGHPLLNNEGFNAALSTLLAATNPVDDLKLAAVPTQTPETIAADLELIVAASIARQKGERVPASDATTTGTATTGRGPALTALESIATSLPEDSTGTHFDVSAAIFYAGDLLSSEDPEEVQQGLEYVRVISERGDPQQAKHFKEALVAQSGGHPAMPGGALNAAVAARIALPDVIASISKDKHRKQISVPETTRHLTALMTSEDDEVVKAGLDFATNIWTNADRGKAKKILTNLLAGGKIKGKQVGDNPIPSEVLEQLLTSSSGPIHRAEILPIAFSMIASEDTPLAFKQAFADSILIPALRDNTLPLGHEDGARVDCLKALAAVEAEELDRDPDAPTIFTSIAQELSAYAISDYERVASSADARPDAGALASRRKLAHERAWADLSDHAESSARIDQKRAQVEQLAVGPALSPVEQRVAEAKDTVDDWAARGKVMQYVQGRGKHHPLYKFDGAQIVKAFEVINALGDGEDANGRDKIDYQKALAHTVLEHVLSEGASSHQRAQWGDANALVDIYRDLPMLNKSQLAAELGRMAGLYPDSEATQSLLQQLCALTDAERFDLFITQLPLNLQVECAPLIPAANTNEQKTLLKSVARQLTLANGNADSPQQASLHAMLKGLSERTAPATLQLLYDAIATSEDDRGALIKAVFNSPACDRSHLINFLDANQANQEMISAIESNFEPTALDYIRQQAEQKRESEKPAGRMYAAVNQMEAVENSTGTRLAEARFDEFVTLVRGNENNAVDRAHLARGLYSLSTTKDQKRLVKAAVKELSDYAHSNTQLLLAGQASPSEADEMLELLELLTSPDLFPKASGVNRKQLLADYESLLQATADSLCQKFLTTAASMTDEDCTRLGTRGPRKAEGPHKTFTEMYNATSNWVKHSIINQPDPQLRAKVIERMVRIQDLAVKAGNLPVGQAIYSGFQSSEVGRLTHTQTLVDSDVKQVASTLNELFGQVTTFRPYLTWAEENRHARIGDLAILKANESSEGFYEVVRELEEAWANHDVVTAFALCDALDGRALRKQRAKCGSPDLDDKLTKINSCRFEGYNPERIAQSKAVKAKAKESEKGYAKTIKSAAKAWDDGRYDDFRTLWEALSHTSLFQGRQNFKLPKGASETLTALDKELKRGEGLGADRLKAILETPEAAAVFGSVVLAPDLEKTAEQQKRIETAVRGVLEAEDTDDPTAGTTAYSGLLAKAGAALESGNMNSFCNLWEAVLSSELDNIRDRDTTASQTLEELERKVAEKLAESDAATKNPRLYAIMTASVHNGVSTQARSLIISMLDKAEGAYDAHNYQLFTELCTAISDQKVLRAGLLKDPALRKRLDTNRARLVPLLAKPYAKTLPNFVGKPMVPLLGLEGTNLEFTHDIDRGPYRTGLESVAIARLNWHAHDLSLAPQTSAPPLLADCIIQDREGDTRASFVDTISSALEPITLQAQIDSSSIQSDFTTIEQLLGALDRDDPKLSDGVKNLIAAADVLSVPGRIDGILASDRLDDLRQATVFATSDSLVEDLTRDLGNAFGNTAEGARNTRTIVQLASSHAHILRQARNHLPEEITREANSRMAKASYDRSKLLEPDWKPNVVRAELVMAELTDTNAEGDHLWEQLDSLSEVLQRNMGAQPADSSIAALSRLADALSSESAVKGLGAGSNGSNVQIFDDLSLVITNRQNIARALTSHSETEGEVRKFLEGPHFESLSQIRQVFEADLKAVPMELTESHSYAGHKPPDLELWTAFKEMTGLLKEIPAGTLPADSPVGALIRLASALKKQSGVEGITDPRKKEHPGIAEDLAQLMDGDNELPGTKRSILRGTLRSLLPGNDAAKDAKTKEILALLRPDTPALLMRGVVLRDYQQGRIKANRPLLQVVAATEKLPFVPRSEFLRAAKSVL